MGSPNPPVKKCSEKSTCLVLTRSDSPGHTSSVSIIEKNMVQNFAIKSSKNPLKIKWEQIIFLHPFYFYCIFCIIFFVIFCISTFWKSLGFLSKFEVPPNRNRGWKNKRKEQIAMPIFFNLGHIVNPRTWDCIFTHPKNMWKFTDLRIRRGLNQIVQFGTRTGAEELERQPVLDRQCNQKVLHDHNLRKISKQHDEKVVAISCAHELFDMFFVAFPTVIGQQPRQNKSNLQFLISFNFPSFVHISDFCEKP